MTAKTFSFVLLLLLACAHVGAEVTADNTLAVNFYLVVSAGSIDLLSGSSLIIGEPSCETCGQDDGEAKHCSVEVQNTGSVDQSAVVRIRHQDDLSGVKSTYIHCQEFIGVSFFSEAWDRYPSTFANNPDDVRITTDKVWECPVPGLNSSTGSELGPDTFPQMWLDVSVAAGQSVHLYYGSGTADTFAEADAYITNSWQSPEVRVIRSADEESTSFFFTVHSASPLICTPVCGNDVLEAGEDCDDGNENDFDGCSSICEREELPTFGLSGPGLIGPFALESGWTVWISNIAVPHVVNQIVSVDIVGLQTTSHAGYLFFVLYTSLGNAHLLVPQAQGWSGNDFQTVSYTIVENGAPFYLDSSPGNNVPPPTGTYSTGCPLGSLQGPPGDWTLAAISPTVFAVDVGISSWWINGNGPLCSPTERAAAACSPHATCAKAAASATPVCACKTGFSDESVGAPGTVCLDINECHDEEILAASCDRLAYCDNKMGSFACSCPEGFYGDGSSCSNNAFSIRTVLHIPGVHTAAFKEADIEVLKLQYARILTQSHTLVANDTIIQTMPTFVGQNAVFGQRLLGVATGPPDSDKITMFALFVDQPTAAATLAALASPDWSSMGATVDEEPTVYRWTGGSTRDALEIPATGLSVDSAVFDASCLSSGCWKVSVTYTKGSDDFNVFFLPRANSADALSYDPSYTDIDATWLISAADTFLPANHPCTTADYDPSSGELPAAVTACCIPEFLAMYRTVDAFQGALSGVDLSAAVCGEGGRTRAVDRATVPWFVKFGQTASQSNSFLPPVSPSVVDKVFVDGTFAGMAHSNIYHTDVADSYIGVYKATLELDEVELRTMAGQRKGTVGVEHTVDTFVGIVNFSPTGSKVLDTFATQAALHLEKTSFFTVSTHGVNDYTFLEYINLRLVTVFLQDADVSDAGNGAATSDFIETSSADSADYVQVTFTLGSKYGVNAGASEDSDDELIPSSSVRAGQGTFFDDVDADAGASGMVHKCVEYAQGSFDAAFDSRLNDQDCSPAAAMCVSPESIADHFVSYNIPLGMDYFPVPNKELSENIFVSMVINAVDLVATAASGTALPNQGGAPWQMKTTLTASIPVIEGGINIFCDGLTAKTDLKDVADADIVVGTASSDTELTRLRVVHGVANTELNKGPETVIDTDSIEAALMTLVLLGNHTYFTNAGATNTGGYALELDDLITIHLMEDGEASTTSKETALIALLNQPAEDNSDATGLDTDGYQLNGAFKMDVDRASGIPKLNPTPELLAVCPFNPPRPSGTSAVESCITRRDVQERRFPTRAGAGQPTAMEILKETAAVLEGQDLADERAALLEQKTAGVAPFNACTCTVGTACCEAAFLGGILGDSDFARDLAVDFVNAIDLRYALNGRWTRAFWINPGYEWAPAQAGGTPLFSVSQTIYLFALVSLDENKTPSRRMLLQTSTKDARSRSAAAAKVTFAATPRSVLAGAFNVPVDKVASFNVELQLTEAEACMAPYARVSALQSTLADYVERTASTHKTVQITSISVELHGFQCSSTRRSLRRRLLASFSPAVARAQMMIVFEDGREVVFDQAGFAQLAGVNTIQASPSNTAHLNRPLTYAELNADDDDTRTSSSAETALIAGVAGAVVGALLVAGAVAFWVRARQEAAEAIPIIDVESLKSQLASEL